MKTIAASAIVLLICICASVSAQESSSIGYRTVAEAYAALRKDPNAKFSTQAGWVIVDVREGLSLWSFTPNTHPAYPAVIRRTPTEVGGAIYLTMQVLCEATKRACDQLVDDFKKLNEQMLRDSQSRLTFQTPPGIVDEINLTPDSSPGWTPTADQRQRAIKAVHVFLDAVESGRYAEAYGLQAELKKRDQTLEQFIQDAQKFQALAGPLKFWRVLKVTWTKDSARAPSAGIYVAVDLAGQFANVDRDCGYLVLFQPPSGGDFAVMRRENNYLDNATAHNIEEKQSKAGLAKVWSQASRYCPNYVSPE
jgi:hypothetical protein